MSDLRDKLVKRNSKIIQILENKINNHKLFQIKIARTIYSKCQKINLIFFQFTLPISKIKKKIGLWQNFI